MAKLRGPEKTVWWVVGAIVATQAARVVGNAFLDGDGLNLAASFITVAAVFFLGGLIVQDFRNPKSWVRHNWRELNRVFTVNHAHVITTDDGFNDHINAKVQFTRDVQKGRLVVRVYSCTQRRAEPTTILLLDMPLDDLPKGRERLIPIGQIPHAHPEWKPRHMVWGDASYGAGDYGVDAYGSGKFMISDSHNVIEIEARAGWRKQTHRLYLRAFDQYKPIPWRAFMIPEDQDIFDTAPLV